MSIGFLVFRMSTLVHIYALLVLAVLVFFFRSFKTPTRTPETICLKRELAETPSDIAKERSSMHSLLYRPPSKVPREPYPAATSPVMKEQYQATPRTGIVAAKQPYDAFLVLDVEATCLQGTGFEWANEIIEWPVCVLRWKDMSVTRRANRLEIVGEFRSFVKPTWRPQLSQFCTDLTGITQAQVDYAPTFPKVLKMFARFLAQHGLIDPNDGRPLQRFCWCSDGPFDIRDFVVKQCFISNVPMPSWLRGDVLDVRKVVSIWAVTQGTSETQIINKKFSFDYIIRSMNITQQLRVLRLGPFQGKAHCGIDDTRNVARIIIELARRGIRLEPNTSINPNKRWQWMGRPGEVLEYYLF